MAQTKLKTEEGRLQVVQRRREIILGRLRGESSVTLANRMGVSRECICKQIRGLPKRPEHSDTNPTREVIELPCDEETVCDICMDYLKGESEEMLMQKYDLNRKDLMNCFYAVTDKVACYNIAKRKQMFIYCVISDKRQTMNISASGMARSVGINSAKFKEIMKGWKPMPYDMADSISESLNISVSDICREIVDFKSERNDGIVVTRHAKQNFCRAVEEMETDSGITCIADAVCWAYYMSKYESTEAAQ